MKTNRISVQAYFVNGSMQDVLEDATPQEAIENYLLPDMRPPVQTLVISVATKEGKHFSISISQTSISVREVDEQKG